ncbi:hypothetical protein BMERY_0229 [Bifidobacterium merycicum]|uniref:Uncharacterized protein n=1 Tax=Bifidobacterium merycicum TaxID=78345 RepID=A0A087BIE8_9BIFI|nr:hypothetical protein BMERY_0229 [Bifidobacterium merycicum]
MDRAKTLKDGRELTVFAHDLSSKGRKRVTRGARFKCPYCGRPVDLAALDSTKVTTYFKHHRNDELAKFCDEYVSGNGSGNLLMRNPVVPIFLDFEGESTKRYVLKTGLYGIGKRLRSDLKKTTEAYMSVNGRTYPLWQMAAESLRIPIRKLPTLELSNEITVMAPESIRRRIGEAEDCRSGMVFTSDYDSAPPNHANHIGIRIRRGNDVYVGRRYYLVIDSREPKLSKSVATSFDTAKKSRSPYSKQLFHCLACVCCRVILQKRDRCEYVRPFRLPSYRQGKNSRFALASISHLQWNRSAIVREHIRHISRTGGNRQPQG